MLGFDGPQIEKLMSDPGKNDKRVGTLIENKYRIDRLVARGGFSSVYRGTHTAMGRPIAIKVLELDQNVEASWLERFTREARLVSQLRHPNTITIFDFGQDERGFLWIVMEYINGRSLSRQVKKYGALSPKDAAFVAAEILKSLDEAHARGILHRDLKPSNIMIARDHNDELVVKVLDFGVAKILEPDPEVDIKLTAQGAFVGTPRYASPEQMKREPVTVASDIYGVGMILWEALVGAPAVPDIDFGSAVQHHLGPQPWRLPMEFHCPPGLAHVLYTALQKKPDDRYTDCQEMLHDLETWMKADEEPFPEPLEEVFNAISEVEEDKVPIYREPRKNVPEIADIDRSNELSLEDDLSGDWQPDAFFDPDAAEAPSAAPRKTIPAPKTPREDPRAARASSGERAKRSDRLLERTDDVVDGLAIDPKDLKPARRAESGSPAPAPASLDVQNQHASFRKQIAVSLAGVVLVIGVIGVFMVKSFEDNREDVSVTTSAPTESADLPLIATDTILAGMRTAGWLTSGNLDTSMLGATKQTHTMTMYTKENLGAAVTIYECESDALAHDIANTTVPPSEVVTFGRTVVKVAPGPSSIGSGVRQLTGMLFTYKEMMRKKGQL